MEVLKTTSPTLLPKAPMAVPRNTVPSAKTKMAGLVCDTGCSLELDIKKRDERCVHPAFDSARIIAEEGLPIKCGGASCLPQRPGADDDEARTGEIVQLFLADIVGERAADQHANGRRGDQGQ